jgi:LysM repeat protein
MRLRIVLPLAAVAALAVPAGAHAELHHTVTPGESLTSIAAAGRVSITALAGANRLAPDAHLITGSVLRIPPPGSGIRSSEPNPSRRRPSAPPIVRRYRVQPGDTLTGVAAHHHVTVSYLATLNHLRPTALLIAGTTLTLSRAAPRTVAARPATRRYVIRPGDTLTGVAARDGVSASDLAALNHLRPTALLIAGATLTVPATATSTTTTRRPATRRYVVQPGDTLTGVAAHDGVTVSYLAALNHLGTSALLIAGATLTVPGTEPTRGGPPYPTLQRVTVSQVEQVAAENRVAAWLGAAIAWEESGFNNALVSSADARGVMQILPGTWAWIQDTQTLGVPLAPASAIDNVRGGVLYLRALLHATGGDLRLAIAGYVQGLASVRANGMFAVTRQYVSDVMALRQRFA